MYCFPDLNSFSFDSPLILSTLDLNKDEHITGVRTMATNPEIKTAPANANANSSNNLPILPGENITGINTATNVNVIATTANPTSEIAFFAASIGDTPLSRYLTVFSNTTIASSTTKPTATTIASKVRVFIEKPKNRSKLKVPIRDIGIVIIGINAALKLLSETTITRETKIIASKIVLKTASIERSIKIE